MDSEVTCPADTLSPVAQRQRQSRSDSWKEDLQVAKKKAAAKKAVKKVAKKAAKKAPAKKATKKAAKKKAAPPAP
jgi:hypothetical protein